MNIALRKSFLDIQEVIASPPPLKPIHLKQQELYVQPLQSSYRDIYCALPKSESYGSTMAPNHHHHHGHHHNHHRRSDSHRSEHKRCRSDYSNGYLNQNPGTQSANSDKHCTSVSKYYSNMLMRQASPYDEGQMGNKYDTEYQHHHPHPHHHHRSRKDYHLEFPKPKLETLPSEPLAKGEQYYVDLSGHIHKGSIKTQEKIGGKGRHRFKST